MHIEFKMRIEHGLICLKSFLWVFFFVSIPFLMEHNVCFISWLLQDIELIFSRNFLLQTQDVVTDWYR